jgi:hypothetical protein
MNHGLKRDVGYFHSAIRHLPTGTEENHESLNQNNWTVEQDFNPVPHDYEAGILPI